MVDGDRPEGGPWFAGEGGRVVPLFATGTAARAVNATAVPPDAPLAVYRELFRSLPSLAPGELLGRWDALQVGPRWYRALFGALLWMGGLRGWIGKEFAWDGTGVNLCRRGDRVVARSRLRVEGPAPSRVDGEPSLLLRYLGLSPLRLVRDELRRAPDGTVLGLTYLDVAPLSLLRLPFAIAPRARRR